MKCSNNIHFNILSVAFLLITVCDNCFIPAAKLIMLIKLTVAVLLDNSTAMNHNEICHRTLAALAILATVDSPNKKLANNSMLANVTHKTLLEFNDKVNKVTKSH